MVPYVISFAQQIASGMVGSVFVVVQQGLFQHILHFVDLKWDSLAIVFSMLFYITIVFSMLFYILMEISINSSTRWYLMLFHLPS